METCLEASPSIEVGERERDFVAFSDPPEAMMVHGPQGGWHILGSLQLQHTRPIVEVHFPIPIWTVAVLFPVISISWR